jgi:hypothetical protein
MSKAPPPGRMTVAEFLPWAEEAHARGEGRFELVDGVVTAMNAERAVHWKTNWLLPSRC